MPKEKVVVTLTDPQPKKHSVQFSSKETDAPLTSIYLMRSGAKKHLGIQDLDSVKEIKLTIEAA